jgi:glycosyltransferase involved in cell wall biosynthesis
MKPLIALFDPVLPHYRAALVQELQMRARYDFQFFSDAEDIEGRIPALLKRHSGDFTICKTRRLPFGMRWQTNTVRACISRRFAAIILPGNARWLSSWVGVVAARATGKPVLFWTHGWTRKDKGVTRVIRNAFYSIASGLLLYGNRAHEIGLGLGFDAARLHVMYNSLDVDEQARLLAGITPDDRRQMRRELFGSADTPVAIASARLTHSKRFDLAIRAIAAMNRSNRQVNLLIVGDGPEQIALQQLANQERVPVHFAGACYDETQMAKYFSCAAVTVSPGNVGLTCMHSMGYGVPVITHSDAFTQGPEWEAIEPGFNGDLFEKGSVEDLTIKISAWTVFAKVPEKSAAACLGVINEKYRPDLQRRAIESALNWAFDL